MPLTIIPREQVAQNFAVSTTVLIRYEARGLIQPVRLGEVEGYGPAEIRRLWTILSLQRDLGINLAGVEAILKLRAQMEDLHRRLRDLADALREALEADSDTDEQP
ncbi:MAG: MerR family transcriptional regulator [Isosphaeraceae bacterium]|nr:MerR family transcriptional regulator [Isosphaeraceae bacterium]